MREHTKEPWRVEQIDADMLAIFSGEHQTCVFADLTNDPVVGIFGDPEGAHADMKRIVACINACAGVSNEQLAQINDFGGVRQLALAYDAEIARCRQLEQRREELVQALVGLLNMPEADGTQSTAVARRDAKRTARTIVTIDKLEVRP